MNSEHIKKIQEYSKRLKVLYVEDNVTSRDQTVKMFQNFFDDIECANDGVEGLEKFENNQFDLVISDINMPNMNGLEMFEKIRLIDETVPLIVISAYDETEFFLKSIELATDGYLIKPINIEQVIPQFVKTITKIKLFSENKVYKERIEKINIELEQKVQQKTDELKERFYLDELTGLQNRFSLSEKLENQDKDKNALLININIDSFSIYNDLYGLEVGNAILKKFADTLKYYAELNKFYAYRSHGDNFLLYKEYDESENLRLLEIILVIENYIKKQDLLIEEIEQTINLTVTIGCAYGKENLILNSSSALDYARKNLKKYFIYNSSLDKTDHLKNTLFWKKELLSALDEDRIEPYFQPIYNRNREVAKYESLIRIKSFSLTKGEVLVSPIEFLDIAKKTKLYNKISFRVISKAIDYAIEKRISISINLTVVDLENITFMNMLLEKVRYFFKKNSDKKLIIEILEDESIKDYNEIKDILYSITNLGVELAIDDFGSGYSNLKHILGLSPAYIKIDASLIKDIDTDPKSKELVKAIIQFAKASGIKTIAEFVYSQEIYEIVYTLGVDEFQGYYFSKPKAIDMI